METAEYDNKVYSTDMAIMWANEFGKAKKEPVSKYIDELNTNAWYDDNNKPVSPVYVLEHKDNKEFDTHLKRIQAADLKYPILVYDDYVIDGYHRLTKAFLQHKKDIKVIKIPKEIFDKFYVGDIDTFYNNPDKSLINLIANSHKDKYHILIKTLYDIRFNS